MQQCIWALKPGRCDSDDSTVWPGKVPPSLVCMNLAMFVLWPSGCAHTVWDFPRSVKTWVSQQCCSTKLTSGLSLNSLIITDFHCRSLFHLCLGKWANQDYVIFLTKQGFSYQPYHQHPEQLLGLSQLSSSLKTWTTGRYVMGRWPPDCPLCTDTTDTQGPEYTWDKHTHTHTMIIWLPKPRVMKFGPK